MQVERLGHAVLKVRDIERAEDFYHGVLRLPVAAGLQGSRRPETGARNAG